MCGICGYVAFDPTRPVEAGWLEQMTATLVHRGPDEQAILVREPVGMGIRRLQVIDLTPGVQPVSNEDGRIWAVQNGEIYNFQELRAFLESKGHRFRSRTDTEVLVHLYEEEGEELVHRLVGMFAFALWDESAQKLFVARDRLGQKPLYYHLSPDGFFFASEIKALLQDQRVPREPDWAVLSEYLTDGYVSSPNTIFRHIRKVPPGHRVVVQNGRVTINAYWRVPVKPANGGAGTEDADSLLERLTEAVRSQLVSDVPLGVALSGGIDSTALVAIVRRVLDRPVRTFTVGFKDAGFDERNHAAVVARQFDTDHHEALVDVGSELKSLLPRLIWHLDEPFADSTALALYYLARESRLHIKVLLGGDGGDEVFGGYNRYRARRAARWLLRWPRAVREGLLGWLADRVPVSTDYYTRSWARQLQHLIAYARALEAAPDATTLPLFSSEDLSRLCPEVGSLTARPERRALLHSEGSELDDLARTLWMDLQTYLPEDILFMTDRMTMAVGLEMRAPFLDHRLIEYMVALPVQLKVGVWSTKVLLRRALAPLVSKEILRRPKHGFAVPVGHWLKGSLRTFAEPYLLDVERFDHGVFDRKYVRQIWSRHQTGRQDWGAQLWALLCFELWYRAFIMQKPSSHGIT